MMTSETLLTRNFILGFFSSLTLTMVFFVYYTGMSMYTLEVLGKDTVIAGTITGIFIAGDVVARFLTSRYIPLIGPKRTCMIFLTIGTLITLLYFLTQDVSLICGIAFFHGVTYGIVETSIYTIVISGIPQSRRGEGIGYFMLSNSLASILGPFISISLQNSGAYTEMFIFGTMMSFTSFILILPVRRLPRKENLEQIGHGISSYIEKSALRVSLVMFLFFFTYSGVLTFIAPYGAELGLEVYASVFFIAVSVSTLFCRLFLGRIYDIHGENVALIPPLLMYIAGMFMLSSLISGPEMLLSGLLIGTMVAMLNTVSQALVVRDVPDDRVSVAVSTLSIFWDLSFAAGPLVHGYIAYGYGLSTNYLVMAIIASISFVVYLVLVGIPGYRRRHQLLES